MSAISKLMDQCRKPTGPVGRFLLWSMNRSHSPLTDWALEPLSIERQFTILDVGCGGGRTIRKLANIATLGKVYGIDHSEESVAAARRTNKNSVKTGRVEIGRGSVSHLPFSTDMFDLVTAVETHYFWPDLPGDMREILRVLKPAGKLIIIAEAYKGGEDDDRLQKLADLANLAFLTASEHRELFSNAGYSGIEIIENQEKRWICAVGRKPT